MTPKFKPPQTASKLTLPVKQGFGFNWLMDDPEEYYNKKYKSKKK